MAISIRRREARRPADPAAGQVRTNDQLKTAKSLGLEFHPQLLATTDEVIE
jgi:hypothetical protein